MGAPQETGGVRARTIANICIDFVRAGYTLSPHSTEFEQMIENSDGKLVQVLGGELKSKIVGEALNMISRRLHSQQNQQAL